MLLPANVVLEKEDLGSGFHQLCLEQRYLFAFDFHNLI